MRMSDDHRSERFYRDDEDYTALYERMMFFMGAFSVVQERIEYAVERRLQLQLPELGPVVALRLMSRLSDDQRIALLLGLAADVGYTGFEPEAVQRVYEDARQTRNALAHSPGVFVLRDDPSRSRHIVTGRGNKHPRVPDRLQPSAIDRLKQECKWLEAHLYRLMYEAKLATMTDFLGEPYEPELPPSQPPAH
jgi:hypothetical protein